jgi:hypothetical protein
MAKTSLFAPGWRLNLTFHGGCYWHAAVCDRDFARLCEATAEDHAIRATGGFND